MIHSLRTRLLVGTTITMVLALSLLGLAVDASLRGTLVSEFDNALLSKAQAIASFVEQHGDDVRFEFDPQRMPEFTSGPRAAFFEVWIEGRRTDTSDSLPQGQSLSHGGLPNDHLAFAAITLPNGNRGRVVMFPFKAYMDEDYNRRARQPAHGVIYAAIDTVDLDRTLAKLRLIIGALCIAAIGVCGAALLVVVSRAMRPLSAVARQIDSLNEAELATRIAIEGLPTELRPMVDRLNSLLGRLEQAFNRERGFTADVAHELRTPIAGLRTTLEVCRSRPRDPAVYAAAIDRSLRVIGSMQGVIENLLLLARAESGQLPILLTEIDVVELVRDAWLTFAGRAAEGNITVQWTLPETYVIPCDAAKLRIVLTNLFDNAVSYTNAGGTMDVRLWEQEGRTHFRIGNSGSQIAPNEIPKLFERFWRKDESRSQTGLHAGLGLSLCQRLLALSDATIGARVEGDRFVIEFILPQASKRCVPV